MGEALLQAKENEGELLLKAKTLANDGRWKEAATLIENGKDSFEISIKGKETLAFYYSRGGDYDKAISIFSELSRLQPQKALWHNYIGFQFQQKKQWIDAIASYEECLKLAPQWLKPLFSLGKACESAGQVERALANFRRGVLLYKELPPDSRHAHAEVYGSLCTTAAKLLLSRPKKTPDEVAEALQLFRESSEVAPNDPNSWYRIGNLLFDLKRNDEALVYLKRAEELAPKKEYICHKIAQIYLRNRMQNEALKKYEKIPPHRQSPYILRGIALCYLDKNEPMEAAKRLHLAIKKEPEKFYHYWDFALALIELGARDQALEALEMANQLFIQEQGRNYEKALTKINEIKSTLLSSVHINFDTPSTEVPSICFGTVIKYNKDRGFGFIKDGNDGATVFFHISRVKDSPEPQRGSRARFVREAGEKGPQASRVWLSDSS